jgi:hypothetical protein
LFYVSPPSATTLLAAHSWTIRAPPTPRTREPQRITPPGPNREPQCANRNPRTFEPSNLRTPSTLFVLRYSA